VGIAAVLACGPADATTVGGSTQTTNGPFALARMRIFVPTFVADDPGMASPGPPGSGSMSTPGIRSFGPGNTEWSGPDLTSDGNGTPALASSGRSVAIAWLAPNLQSGLVKNGQVVAPATHSANGALGGFDVAVAPDSSRAIAWSDANGVHLQAVTAAGAAAPEALLAPDLADLVTATPGDAGTWWVLWRTSNRLFARHVAADGSLGSLRELAAAAATDPPRAPFLDPAGEHAWTAVTDGHDGLWVGLPRGLLHVTPTAVATVASSSRPVVLATSGGRVSLVYRTGRRDISLRTIAGGTKRTVRLTGRGSPIDATTDAATGKTYLLSSDAKENVRLTEITAGGKHRSTALPFCHRRHHGQVAASAGLVAVACAGRFTSQDSVETGGDFRYGRDEIYVLMRDGKVLRRQSLFEGDYSY
jgi:hypothetical protein